MKTAMAAIVLASLALAEARAEEARFRFDGLKSAEGAEAVVKALAGAEAEVVQKPTVAKPVAVIKFEPKKADVGDLAKAVASAKVPAGDKAPPGTILLLKYERLDANPLADEVFLPKVVEPVFAKLKGVEAKRCKIVFKERELHIFLSPSGGAKLAEIKSAFPGLSIK